MGFRKSVLIASASLLAVLAGMASPALAQTAAPAPDEEEIVVTGIRGSLIQSIDAKRDAASIVDVLSAEDVGKFPDQNVAEALQRVPGIQINREFGEGERVSVRGLAPNLTRTLLNGHSLATADWFILEQLAATRSFNYLMLPSEIIGQVNVFKSPTADIEEGGVGGTVDVRTRKPLDLDQFEIAASVQGAYTERSDSWDPQASGLLSWTNSDETFGLLIAGVYDKRNIRRDGVEVLGYIPVPGSPGLMAPGLIGSALFQQERIREGGNFAAQWRPDDQWDFVLSGLYSRFGADNFNQNFLAWPNNALGNGATLTNRTIVDDTVVAGTVQFGAGTAGRGAVFDAIDRIAHAQTRNIDFDVTHTPNEDWKLHFQAGYTDAEGNTEAQPFVEFAARTSFTYDLRGGAPQVTFQDIDPTDPSDPLMQFDFASLHQVTNDDSEKYAYFDIDRRVDLGPLVEISAGIKYTDHDRETAFLATTFGGFFLNIRCGAVACTAADFAGDVTPSDFLENIAVPGTLTSYFQVDRGLAESILFGVPGATQNRILNPPENFSVNERTAGGYLMGRLEGENWRGNVGVRVVETRQTSTGNVIFTPETAPPNAIPNAFGPYVEVSFQRTYTDVLPSANIAFDLSDDIVLRAAAARTVGRPDFTDIVPRVTLNPGALTGAGGNPDLDPYRATQYDVSLEWYPTRESVFAVGAFYKDIESFITSGIQEMVFPLQDDTNPNPGRCVPSGEPDLFNCTFLVDVRSNGGGGTVKGVEAIAQTSLFAGFGVIANYTYSNGETESGDPLPGNSENTVNLTGYFENDSLSARLSWTYRSDFFVTFDRASPLNQKELSSLDASVSYNVTPHVAVTFDAINLTNELIEQFAGEEFRPRAIYDNGRQFYVGARMRY